MICRFEVDGLNGHTNAKYECNEKLNIITGVNGSGKTTLLKAIWYLISGHLEQIVPEIPFQHFLIETDPFLLTITKSEPNKVNFLWKFNQEDKQEETLIIDPQTNTIERTGLDVVNKLEKKIAKATKSSLFFPTFRRIEGGFSRFPDSDDSEIKLFSVPEMLQLSMSRFSSEVSVNGHKFITSISTEDISELLTQKHADIYEEINDRQSQVLEEISSEMKKKPNKDKNAQIPQDDLLTAIQKVSEEREQLSKPFSVLSELSRKILRYNAIRVTGRAIHGETTEGITLGEGRDGITVGEAKDAISSDKLSSGEKQMLSFLCYNAFYNNTAIFIDEPELSLHVDWQRLLLPTLLEQGTNNQFFIATHSPFIYANYPDEELLLGDDQGGEN